MIETLPIAGINSFVARARQVCRATGNTACTTFFARQKSQLRLAIERHSSVIMAENISSSEINNAICSSLIFFPGIHELKPEQILVIQNIVHGKDVFAALPTGFGKSLTFQILPSVLKSLQSSYESSSPLVIVVCPLKSII